MKILVIAESFPYKNYQVGIFIKKQVDSIKSFFSEINVISPNPYVFWDRKRKRNVVNYSYENVNVFFPKVFYIPKGYIKNFSLDFRLKAILKEIKVRKIEFDLIHIHFGTLAALLHPLKELFNKPIITSFYGYDAYINLYDKKFYEKLFMKGDLFLTLSDHMTRKLVKKGCPKQKIKKLHIGIDTDYFKPKNKNFTRMDEKIKLLLVARFAKNKGIIDALKAVYIVKNKFKDISFDIVGYGPQERKIKNEIKKLNLEKEVKLHDNRIHVNPHKLVHDFMQNCDIFILPSYTLENGESEGTPVVLMEASACEVAIVSTFHSGIPEIVINNKTGLLVPERDPKSLSGAIMKLITDPDLRKTLGKNARKHIIQNFNQKTQKHQLLDIYDKFK